MATPVEKKLEEIGRIAYDINHLLGQGELAKVFSGTFRGENGERSSVAVKRIEHKDVTPDEREVKALESLKGHPNVMQLYGAERDDNFHYFALELCAASMDEVFLPDGNPKKYRGPLPSDLDVLLQLSEGLCFIHEKGFVHGNIKPGNVLVSFPKADGSMVMKWADFGLSNPVSSGGTSSISGVRGIINWTDPEILATLGVDKTKEPRGTMESDTWLAGCVFGAYLTKGKHPFGKDSLDVRVNVRLSSPVNLKELSIYHFAANMIREMIRRDPAERMKLVDVVNILKEVKEEMISQRREQDNYSAGQELEAGQLYSWEQWNLALKEGELYVWSQDVAIEGILQRKPELLRIKLLRGYDRMKVGSIQHGGPEVPAGKERGRKDGELNREMFEKVGITRGTPSRSPLNAHVVSDGKEWTIFSSGMLGDTLTIKGEEHGDQKWELVLFGPSFHSTFHVTEDGGETIVCATDRAKMDMEEELLGLCPWEPEDEHYGFSCSEWPNPEEVDRIAALLRAGVDPNCRDGIDNNYYSDSDDDDYLYAVDVGNQTPLLRCVRVRDEELLLKLLTILLEGNRSRGAGSIPKKVNLNVKDRQGRNAFLLLLDDKKHNHRKMFESLKLLVHEGIDVNLRGESGDTVLHYICAGLYDEEGVVEAVKFLVENGIDVTLKGEGGLTALHWLCRSSYDPENVVGAMELLLEKGIDVNWADEWKRTALHLLCQKSKNVNIVPAMKLLIEKGADVNLKGGLMLGLVQLGRTALHELCARFKNDIIFDAIQLLIKNGADVNLKDVDGRTALHLLCENGRNENIVDAMGLLIEKGADVTSKDKRGLTALHYLCRFSGNENIAEAIKLLMEKGVDVNLKDDDGRTALHLLCLFYKGEYIVDAIKLFVEYGADVNLTDERGQTALHALCWDYRKENVVDAVKILIENGADVDKRDMENRFGSKALDILGVANRK